MNTKLMGMLIGSMIFAVCFGANTTIVISPANMSVALGSFQKVHISLYNYTGNLTSANLTVSNIAAFNNPYGTCISDNQTQSFNCTLYFYTLGNETGTVSYNGLGVNSITNTVITNAWYNVYRPNPTGLPEVIRYPSTPPSLEKIANGYNINNFSQGQLMNVVLGNQTLIVTENYFTPTYAGISIGAMPNEVPYILYPGNATKLTNIAGNSTIYASLLNLNWTTGMINVSIYGKLAEPSIQTLKPNNMTVNTIVMNVTAQANVTKSNTVIPSNTSMATTTIQPATNQKSTAKSAPVETPTALPVVPIAIIVIGLLGLCVAYLYFGKSKAE